MMKQLLLTMFTMGCLFAFSSRSYACFCVTAKVPEAFKQAKAIFLGAVVDIVEPKTSSETALAADRFFTIKFKIERSWKGVPFGAQDFKFLRPKVATDVSPFHP